MKYFLWVDSKQAGPYEEQQIRDMIKSGRITALTLGHIADGGGEWNQIGSFFNVVEPSQSIKAVQPPPVLKTPSSQEELYYYKIGDTEKGPYTIGQLRSLWSSGMITSDMPYRVEGNQSWNRFSPSFIEKLESPASPKSSMPAKSSLECPFCHCKNLLPKKEVTMAGWVTIVIGALTAAFCIGILLLIVGFSMKEQKYQCCHCGKTF
jgi:hypothetical protein